MHYEKNLNDIKYIFSMHLLVSLKIKFLKTEYVKSYKKSISKIKTSEKYF